LLLGRRLLLLLPLRCELGVCCAVGAEALAGCRQALLLLLLRGLLLGRCADHWCLVAQEPHQHVLQLRSRPLRSSACRAGI
jgi:hypothetical protein